MPFFEMR